MEINVKDSEKVLIRTYEERDFNKIQSLNREEGWLHLVENHLNTKEAWKNSNVAYVMVAEEQGVVSYLRGFTDNYVSLFICELLIEKNYRGLGLGKKILHFVHNIYSNTRVELLANSSSRSFYEGLGFRAFYGFRKSIQE